MQYRDEVTDLLQRLLRVDTTNPPGNETAVALILSDYLESNGVACELVARDPERANLVARIPGDGSGPSLALIGHTDVVPARAEDWVHPPFGGHLDDDGFLWGRGAADMKNEVASRAVVMAQLAREGFRPAGDLTFVAAADEEDGTAHVGMSWLVEERPDLAADFVLNEGAAERLPLADGRTAVTINVGEKAAASVRITAVGEPTASTLPTPGASAVVRLASIIGRLDGYRFTPRLIPETRAILESLVGALPQRPSAAELEAALVRVNSLHPAFAELVVPLFATTVAPTRLTGSDALNVIPARASVDCDCRLVPHTTFDDLRGELAAAIGDDVAYELETLFEVTGGSVSPADSPMMDVVGDVLAELDPDAVLVPTLLNGFTDSHYYRQAFGSQAYGFWPTRSTPYDAVVEGVHGNNERIHVDDLEYATDFQVRVVRRLLGPSDAPAPTTPGRPGRNAR